MQSTMSHGVTPARRVDACRGIEVGGAVEAQEVEPAEELAHVRLPLAIPCAGHHFHHDRLGDGVETVVATD